MDWSKRMRTLPHNSGENRIEWIDSARAIGIFFVILGHSPVPPGIHKYIFSFHIPLFFFLAGLFIDPHKSYFSFVKKKAQRLLVPYFVINLGLLLFFFAGYLIMGEGFDDLFGLADIDLLSLLLETLYYESDINPPLWFFLSLFIAYNYLYGIGKIQSKAFIFITLASCYITGALIIKLFAASLFWNADIAFIGVFFSGLAFLSRDFILPKFNQKWALLLILLMAGLLSGIFVMLNDAVDMRLRSFGNHIYFIIAACSGITFWLIISRTLPQNSITSYIGRNSIVFFAFHLIVMHLLSLLCEVINIPATQFYPMMKFMHPQKSDLFFIIIALIYSVITLICIIPIVEIINRCFPWLIGLAHKK